MSRPLYAPLPPFLLLATAEKRRLTLDYKRYVREDSGEDTPIDRTAFEHGWMANLKRYRDYVKASQSTLLRYELEIWRLRDMAGLAPEKGVQ